MRFFHICGIMGFPLLILTGALAVLVTRAALARGAGDKAPALFPILFWGFVAAVLGFLGQVAGLYHALTAISRAEELSPRIIRIGLMESFSTTLWGGALLLLAVCAYGLLSLARRRRSTGERNA